MMRTQAGQGWLALGMLAVSCSVGCVSLPSSTKTDLGMAPPEVQSAAALDTIGDPAAPPNLGPAAMPEQQAMQQQALQQQALQQQAMQASQQPIPQTHAQVGYATPTQASAPQSVYKLTLMGLSAKPQQKVTPLPQDLYLQDALQIGGVFKKYGAMKITLIRTVPGETRRHRMEVFVASNKVDELHNYLLRPGDHIVVEKDNVEVDDVVENITGLLGF